MGKKIGIDLGTTYSCVSYVDDKGIPYIITPAESDKFVTPSVVYFDSETNEVVVGDTARDEGKFHPECIVERVKNYMGDPGYTLNINGQDYSPAAISSLILKKLIKDAESMLGEGEIEGAIITCPAYFGDAAREATRAAGENVELSNGQKLKVLQILDEPVAAAIAYANFIREDVQKTILVYDLGGGTFDVTVMKLDFVGDDRKMEVITTNGNHQLGGKDWDAALTDYVIEKFSKSSNADADEMKSNIEFGAWCSEHIEKAKMNLSQKEKTIVRPLFNGIKGEIEITREIFEAETESLLNQTIQLVNDMMEKKELKMADDIDEILLVGGSTRMPQVKRRLEEEYRKPICFHEPVKDVAIGAALVADGLKIDAKNNKAAPSSTGGTLVIGGEDAEIEIIVKCTKSYGLFAKIEDPDTNTEKDMIGNIIMKDTEKPAIQTRTFETRFENQTSVELEVYENDNLEKNATVEESKKMYESCFVELTPGLPKGAPLEVTYHLDASGILIITVLDVTNNISKEVQPIRIGGNVNDVGMERAKRMSLG